MYYNRSMRKFYPLFIILLILVQLAPALIYLAVSKVPHSYEPYYIKLGGIWKVREGFDEAWTRLRLNDKDWKQLQLPGLYQYSGLKQSHFTIRREIVLKDSMLGRDLFYMDSGNWGVGRVFMNGIYIGDLGYFDRQQKAYGIDSLEGLVIPSKVISGKTNVIAIELLQNSIAFAGIQDVRFYLGTEKVFRVYFDNNYQLRTFFNYGFLMLGGFLMMLLALLAYMENKSEERFKYIATIYLLFTSFIFVLFVSGIFFSQAVSISIQVWLFVLSVILVTWGGFEFLSFYFYNKISWFTKFNRGVAVFFFIIWLIFKDDSQALYQVVSLLYLYDAIAFILIDSIAVKKILHKQLNIFGVFIFITAVVVLLTALLDMLTNFNIYILPKIFNISLSSTFLLIGMIVLLEFINISTVNKRLSLDLNRVNSELKEMDKIKDDFLANTSHELRTPLNGILGITDSILDNKRKDIPQDIMSNLYLIKASSKRLTHLVTEILDFSKLRNKKMEVNLEPQDLYTVCDIVCTVCKYQVGSKDLLIRNRIPRDFPSVLADENRLQQIFYNLVGNAIKFTEAGSITITAEQNDGMAEIHVKDTGIGVPQEKQSKIFDYFIQGDSSISREYGGAGLGLAITKDLVELHHGTIAVVSELKGGSDFIVRLPIAVERKQLGVDSDEIVQQIIDNEWEYRIAEKMQAQVMKNSSDKTSNLANILVVDDEMINLQVIENYLRPYPYTLFKAMNGMQALGILEKKENHIDLVLLDLMMPKMSGFEVCRTIRKDYEINELPVIMLTAKNQLIDLVEGLNSGANDYMVKPFYREELVSRIHNQLELKEKSYELEQTRLWSVRAFAELAELRDLNTGAHIRRVAEYTRIITQEYRKYLNENDNYITERYIKDIAEASILHDIGKLGIPDHVLQKPGKLSPDEMEVMKTHAQIGGDAIDKVVQNISFSYLNLGREVAYFHHEKYDGSGYPKGLKGKDIPLSARIVALADVYDALVSDRPYRKRMTHTDAYQIIVEEMGTGHFDPDILEIFIANHEKFNEISTKYQ